MRPFTPDMLTAIAAPTTRPVVFYAGEFTTGILRLWSGLGTVTSSGDTYTGNGTLLGVGVTSETQELQAAGMTVKLSGVGIEAADRALQEVQHGKWGQVWIGFLTAAGDLVDTPHTVFRGRLDTAQLDTKDAEKPVMLLQYENELVDLERPRNWRFTHEHQIKLFNDASLKNVATLVDRVIKWGPPF